MKVNDKCPKCKKGVLKNFPILGTDFLICNRLGCGYKIYSQERMDENIEQRFRLFMSMNDTQENEVTTMEIDFILEKAKELLIRDKYLMPVLFIDTDKEMNILGLYGEFNKADRREMMATIGKNFADMKKKIKSISMVSEANLSKVDISKADDDIIKKEKTEAIVVSRLDIDTCKREIIIQEFERSGDGIVFKNVHQELSSPVIFLLDAFMKGYKESRKLSNPELN